VSNPFWVAFAEAPQNFAFAPIFSREPSFLPFGLSYMKDMPQSELAASMVAAVGFPKIAI
jgi:hypothetical protein